MEQATQSDNTPAAAPEVVAAPAKAKSIEFGKGRYSTIMSEAFGDGQRLLGLTPKQAERFARQLGSDLGRLNWDVSVSYGKMSKSGTLTLRDLGKAKVTAGYAVSLAKTCAQLNEVNDYKVVRVNSEGGVELVHDGIAEWLNGKSLGE